MCAWHLFLHEELHRMASRDGILERCNQLAHEIVQRRPLVSSRVYLLVVVSLNVPQR